MPRPQPQNPHESVTLVKGRHRWRFVCVEEDRGQLAEALAAMADRPDLPFDRFDAALVARQFAGMDAPGLARAGTDRKATTE